MLRQPLILLVEDDEIVREVIRKYLERDGFRVLEAVNGQDALDLIHERKPDLVVLDIMLPVLDGFEILQRLRDCPQYAFDETPIIVLSARTDEMDRVFGFRLGIDDYVIKPFSPMELVARIQAVLRRAGRGQSAPVIYDDLWIDERSHRVIRRDQPVALTAKEFDLLLFLARHPGQVFSRTQLIEQLWGYEFPGGERTVTVHIQRLREKLDSKSTDPIYIQTVYGVGYSFNPA